MKEKLGLLFKIIIVLVSGSGLYLNYKLLSNEGILYFTIQSNLMCFLFFLITVILSLFKKLSKNNIYYIFKGMVTMAITMTMFVYQILLSSNSVIDVYNGHMVACNLVHLYVPILVILDYIIFGEKGHLKKRYPFYWGFILIFYFIFSIVYVCLGGTFIDGTKAPYYYMDFNQFGFTRVILNSLILYILFLGYGRLVQILDNKLKK